MPEEVKVKSVEIKLEDMSTLNKNIQVDKKIVGELKALAKIQKNTEVIEDFASMLGNEGKDFPNPQKEQEESEINLLADSFEIEEE